MATSRRKKAEEALLLALAHGATPTQAAEKVGVHKRTVYRRLAEPEFRQKLHAQQAEMVQATSALMTAASGGSVRTLVLLQDASMPANTRRGAARDILSLGLPWREGSELGRTPRRSRAQEWGAKEDYQVACTGASGSTTSQLLGFVLEEIITILENCK